MKQFFISLFASMIVFTAVAQEMVINDANASPRSLTGSFSRLKVSGGIDVYLSQGNAEGIAVSAAKDKYRENIHTDVVDGELRIYYKSEDNAGIERLIGNKKLKVYISFKTLARIEGSGASDFWVNGAITTPALDIDLSGACDLKANLAVTDLNLKLSGASDAKLWGSAVNANIEASGASDVKAYDLVTSNCTAKASGASDINITVNTSFRVDASGASDIYYKGTCSVSDKRSSGASTIKKRD